MWTARQTTVEGNCGGRDFRYRSTGDFAEHWPETIPSIREAGEQLSRDLGVQPGRIFRRRVIARWPHELTWSAPAGATSGAYQTLVFRTSATNAPLVSKHFTEFQKP